MKFDVKKHRKYVIAGGLLLATATPSFAIFGLGDIVFDPSNFGQLISQGSTLLHQLETAAQELQTAQQNLQTAQSTYTTIQANVQRYTGKNAWRNLVTRLMPKLHVHNHFGETAGWDDAMNTDDPSGATDAWTNASVAVGSDATTSLQGETAGNSKQLAALALVEASDSISPACMNAVAQYKSDRSNNVNAQQSLEDGQFDESDTTNSEIEQLNLLNAAQSQHLHELQGQGALHACLAQQMMMQNLQQRNAAAQDLNLWGSAKAQQTANPTYNVSSTNTWTTFVP